MLLGVRLADDHEEVAPRERTRGWHGGGHLRAQRQRPLVVVLHRRRRRRNCRRNCAADRSAPLFREECPSSQRRLAVRAQTDIDRRARHADAATTPATRRTSTSFLSRVRKHWNEKDGALRAYTEGF